MVSWLSLMPQPLRAVLSAIRTVHNFTEKRPSWLTPPAGDWHIDGVVRYPLTVRVQQSASELVDSLFDQLDIDEDGDVSFTGWLPTVGDQVGLYAGRTLVGYLANDDAAAMRQEMNRRRGVVQLDTYVSPDDRTVLAAAAWITPPRRQ
jgi:hypothetical protein